VSTSRIPESEAALPKSCHLDRRLDEALAETFPASDPVTIRFDPLPAKVVERGRRRNMKSGISSWIVLAALISLLILATIFMVLGWNTPYGDVGQEMTSGGYVAMAFGIVLTLALGVGLMALVFYSSRKGHD
jgi:hypothetical protein